MGRGVGFHLAGDVSGYLQLLGAMPCNCGRLHGSRGDDTPARPDGLAGGNLAESMLEAGTIDYHVVQGALMLVSNGRTNFRGAVLPAWRYGRWIHRGVLDNMSLGGQSVIRAGYS